MSSDKKLSNFLKISHQTSNSSPEKSLHIPLDVSLKPSFIYIDFPDPKVRNFYVNYLFKDLRSITCMKLLDQKIACIYENLYKTSAYSDIGIAFDTNEHDKSLNVRFSLKPAPLLAATYSQITLNDTYGIGGALKLPNAFGLLDTISFNAAIGVYGYLKRGFNLTYTLPYLRNDCTLNMTLGNNVSRLGHDIEETNSFQSVYITKRNFILQLTRAYRWNVNNRIRDSKEIEDKEISSSGKVSLSVQGTWDWNKDKPFGSTTHLKGELGVVENIDKLTSFRIKNKSFYEFSETSSVKSMENFFDLGIVFPLSDSKLRINDRFFANKLRGFTDETNINNGSDKIQRGNDVFLKDTVRINLNKVLDIPYVQFRPFLHLTYGYFSGSVFNRTKDVNWLKEAKRKSMLNFGIGISYKLSRSINCEFLVNLLSKGAASNNNIKAQVHIEF